jgi:glycosyltransferase involved in cell wall biosynthesis
MTSERRCIFYRTRAMVDDAVSGSDLRPAKLLQAFRQLGYDVDVVAGPAAARKQSIERVKREILAGARYDFLYAEPPTTPTLLNEPHHFPTHPLLDYRLLGFCHARGIPVVLFYCDVQWRLPGYSSRVGWPKYLVMLPFFHLDLLVYRRVVDAFLVPDRGMLPQIAGWVSGRPSWASMPGFDPAETPTRREQRGASEPLRLFYVGGISPPVYDLTPLLRGSAYASSQGVRHELTICCRQAEWQDRPADYDRYLGANVKVVHNRNRQELIDLYARHDVAVMPYGTLNSDWAMPVKFSEAIGMGLPVLSGSGTATARVAAEQGIGWSVGSSEEDLSALLRKIDGAEYERVREAVKRVQPEYSWIARATEVVAIADEVRSPQAIGSARRRAGGSQ